VSHLYELGWNSFFQQHVHPDDLRVPARVVEEQRELFRVACEAGEFQAELTGHLRHTVTTRSGLPAVGDWVLIEVRSGGRATIHEVFPRKTKFSRKAAGQETVEQIAAANFETVFVMTSLNADLNLRRLERYLTATWDSGAQPVILLTKSDLCTDIMPSLEAVSEVAFGVPIIALSSVTGAGIEQIFQYLKKGQTAVLLGSSGVGKSTLMNCLLGRSVQAVRDIREDDARGRHTTTARRLFILPNGGMLIDTPGMRELQLWDETGGFSQTFSDIQAIAEECRFRDCGHQTEPGCAVQAALAEQRLSPDRLESYFKLRRELRYLARKQDAVARIEETRRWKSIRKSVRELYKHRNKP